MAKRKNCCKAKVEITYLCDASSQMNCVFYAPCNSTDRVCMFTKFMNSVGNRYITGCSSHAAHQDVQKKKGILKW